MRVLLDCRMASWTGVGRYTRGLAGALGGREDIELVELVAPGEEPTTPGGESYESAGHPFSPGGARTFARALREVQADIVHCAHFPTPFPMPHPLVVTVHDFIPLSVAGVMPSSARRLAYRLMIRRAIRGADRIITLSEHSARATREFYAPAGGRISVTPAAADDFAAGEIGALPPVVAGLGRYVFGFGNTRPHKRLDVLLRAWASAEPSLPADVALVLTGDEPEGFVNAAIGDLPRPARIVWLGRADDETLRALYARATAFVFPSSHEGFGLPPLEAMMFGAPVICSDAASLPEVVGNAALLVPPLDVGALANAITRLVTDPAFAGDLAERGRVRAMGFTWTRTAELTTAVYQQVLTSRY